MSHHNSNDNNFKKRLSLGVVLSFIFSISILSFQNCSNNSTTTVAVSIGINWLSDTLPGIKKSGASLVDVSQDGKFVIFGSTSPELPGASINGSFYLVNLANPGGAVLNLTQKIILGGIQTVKFYSNGSKVMIITNSLSTYLYDPALDQIQELVEFRNCKPVGWNKIFSKIICTTSTEIKIFDINQKVFIATILVSGPPYQSSVNMLQNIQFNFDESLIFFQYQGMLYKLDTTGSNSTPKWIIGEGITNYIADKYSDKILFESGSYQILSAYYNGGPNIFLTNSTLSNYTLISKIGKFDSGNAASSKPIFIGKTSNLIAFVSSATNLVSNNLPSGVDRLYFANISDPTTINPVMISDFKILYAPISTGDGNIFFTVNKNGVVDIGFTIIR